MCAVVHSSYKNVMGFPMIELIVKYHGEIEQLRTVFPDILIRELLAGYAIVKLDSDDLMLLERQPQIDYIERPTRIYFELDYAKRASCLLNQNGQCGDTQRTDLTGKDVLVGVIDSGIDIVSPLFRHADGTTRIKRLFDQQSDQMFYTEEEINQILRENPIRTNFDYSGHGTAVAGILSGCSEFYQGVAPESELVVVRLARSEESDFPMTSQLMVGIDDCIRFALMMNMPICINISIGNTYGSHQGDTLLERYIDDVSMIGKSVICVGCGNEGSAGGHAFLRFLSSERKQIEDIELIVGETERSLEIQIWIHFEDSFEISFVTPEEEVLDVNQNSTYPVSEKLIVTSIKTLPRPYSSSVRILLELKPGADGTYVESGIYKIRLNPVQIVVGEVNLYLPSEVILNRNTRFLRSDPYGTLTIPSTADRVISVGAYDAKTDRYAAFSGRGFEYIFEGNQAFRFGIFKPVVVAPGVDILTMMKGSFVNVSGTSFAVPFVTGVCALLMEWGIVRENDTELYGEKMKAYLQRNARRLIGESNAPNPRTGFGALCFPPIYAETIPSINLL